MDCKVVFEEDGNSVWLEPDEYGRIFLCFEHEGVTLSVSFDVKNAKRLLEELKDQIADAESRQED